MQITKKFIIIGMGITSLVAGGGTAFAATISAAPPAAAAPKITAERAVEIAHKAVPGGWVSELDHDRRGAKADVWEIELVKGTQRHEIDVDAATGGIVDQETSLNDDDRDDDDHDDD
jgi:hypothetical protein